MKKKPTVQYEHKHPICIYIPEAVLPDDRQMIFERPLARILSPSIARVDGGGSWLYGATDVWIYTSSLKRALPIIREFLPGRPVPDCTQIQYKVGGTDYHDLYVGGEWQNTIRSIGSHLGFSLAA